MTEPVRDILLSAARKGLKGQVRGIFENAIKSSYGKDHLDMRAEFAAGLERALTAHAVLLEVIDKKFPPH